MRRLTPTVPPAVMLWWRTGSLGPLLIVIVLAALVLRWLPLQTVVPQLRTSDPTTAPLTMLLILPIAIAINATTIEPSDVIHRSGTPARRQLGLLRVLALTATVIASVAVLAPHHQDPLFTITATGVGEALLCARLCGNRLAWLLPAAHASASAFLGATTLNGRSWWAWPAEPQPDPTDSILAAAILAAGLLAYLITNNLRSSAPTLTQA